MFINRFHHVTNVPTSLLNVDDSSVVEIRVFDQREKVVVERHQNPVIVQGIRQLFCIRSTESIFVTSGVYRPATTAKSICDRDPDTLVTVQ